MVELKPPLHQCYPTTQTADTTLQRLLTRHHPTARGGITYGIGTPRDSRTGFFYSIMLTISRASLLAVLLPSSLTPSSATPSENVVCYPELYPVSQVSECNAAINLIPAGFSIDRSRIYSNDPRPVTLPLSPIDRRRIHLLPAIFISGSCIIVVESTTKRSDVRPPEHPAAAMSLTLWPNVKRLAQMVVDKCCLIRSRLPGQQGGELQGESMLEGWKFKYKVTVHGKPALMEVARREGQRTKARMWPYHAGDPVYNLYEPDPGGHPVAAA